MMVDDDKTVTIIMEEMEGYDVQFIVMNQDEEYLEDAQVVFDDELGDTNALGRESFRVPLPGGVYSYQVSKEGYYAVTGSAEVFEDKVIEVILGRVPDVSRVRYQRCTDIRITWSYPEDLATEEYEVVFLDHEDNEIDTQTVTHGGKASEPTPPDPEGMTFIGWDKSLVNITEDTVIRAQYEIKTYTVIFQSIIEGDQYVISEQQVDHGGSADEPDEGDVPEKDGYEFVGWDHDYEDWNYVTEDMTITAEYEPVEEPIFERLTDTDEDWNREGTVLRNAKTHNDKLEMDETY